MVFYHHNRSNTVTKRMRENFYHLYLRGFRSKKYKELKHKHNPPPNKTKTMKQYNPKTGCGMEQRIFKRENTNG